jgi:hypothetical protein
MVKEYLNELNRSISALSAIYEMHYSNELDGLVCLPCDLFEILGNPSCIKILQEPKTYIVNSTNYNAVYTAAEASIYESIHTLYTSLGIIINDFHRIFSVYEVNKASEDDIVYLCFMVYGNVLQMFLLLANNWKDSSGNIIISKSDIDTINSEIEKIKNKIKTNKEISHKKSYQELENAFNQLVKTNIKLDKLLGHAQATNRKTINSLEEQKDLHSRDKEELNSLRELIFSLRNNEEEPALQQDIKFPAHINGNIYCLGGKQNWVNRMKEIMPDIKYIGADRNIKLSDKLDKADEIWFQINGLTHAQYYAAVDIAEKNNVPVKYFKYSSPSLCAKQLLKI